MNVPDVSAAPEYLACNLDTRSELIVLIRRGDEILGQIDVDSERKIHKATSEFMRGRTSIVIAHRIRTIIDADQIAVFDRGRVIDVGTHDELLKRCELYRTLYHAHADPQ